MWLNILIFLVVFVIMLVGLVGEVFGLPGLAIIWLAALGFAIFSGFHIVGWSTIIILLLIWLVSIVINYLLTFVTARQLKISWWGLGGAVLGAIIGFIVALVISWGSLAIIFLLVGSALGGFLGEYYYQRHALRALKASTVVVIGYIVGNVLKVLLSILMIVIFLLALII
jgi:uncharacterized protein